MCLSEKQANYIYKNVEEGKFINVNAMKNEIEQDLDRKDDNPYKRVILNKVYKDEDKTPYSVTTSGMCSMMKRPHTGWTLTPQITDYMGIFFCKLKGEEGEILEVDFGVNPETLKTNYLDLYEDVHAEMIYTNRFDENSDLSTTYLGQMKMTRDTKIKAEEKFPITGQGFTLGKLLDQTACQILLDTGATKYYMSKSYYLRCKCLHALPKFVSNTQGIQVGSGQYVGVLFVIQVIIDIHRHRFEILTLVS